MAKFVDLLGTLRNTFRLGKATLDTSGLTADRTVTLQDKAGALALTSDVTNTSTSYLVGSNTSVPSGNTVANTTTETTFTSNAVIAANTAKSGQVFQVALSGVYSTNVVPTIRIRLKMGSTVLLDTGTITLGSSASNLGWELEGEMVVFSTGASGTVDVQGLFTFSNGLTTALIDKAVNTSTISMDTSIGNTLSATVEWGTAHASNTITLRQFLLWSNTIGAPFPNSPGIGAFKVYAFNNFG